MQNEDEGNNWNLPLEAHRPFPIYCVKHTGILAAGWEECSSNNVENCLNFWIDVAVNNL